MNVSLARQGRVHRPSPALPPRSWLGMLGGGQLGRMFTQAAQALGYRVCVLDPDETSPAGAVAERHLRAGYQDEAALGELARLCPAVSTEFENVPAASLERLAALGVVSPSAAAVAVAQDRIDEKAFIRQCGIATAPYAVVRAAADLQQLPDDLFPGILKAARLGYDGKGQARVASRQEALQAFQGFGGVACVLERQLPLSAELSVLLARGFDGAIRVWPIAQNVHRAGILHTSQVPAVLPAAACARAQEAAGVLAERLDYVGVLCVEFFLLDDGQVLVNEMAPRPHNSGHWTLDASVTSQFEQQARVLAGLPLGDTYQLAPALMLNLLGDVWFDSASSNQPREPDWGALLADPRAKLHLYGKAQPRRARKMGHVTFVADTVAKAQAACGRAATLLGIA
jgi:5-(carboxyamino)imidazole ribonucleotide synthase